MSSDQPLFDISKGAVLFGLGRILESALQFIAALAVIRYLNPAQYGLIALGQVVVSVTTALACFGSKGGIARLISKYRALNDDEASGELIASTLFVLVLTSLAFCLILFFAASAASEIFSKPGFDQVLGAFSFLVIPMVLMETFAAIFRGMEMPVATVGMGSLVPSFFRAVILVTFVAAGVSFKILLVAYVLATWLPLAISAAYIARTVFSRYSLRFRGARVREVVGFSIPLMGNEILSMALIWIATLMIGYFGTSDDVAFFTAPYRLASFLGIPPAAFALLTLPLATKAFCRNDFMELRATFVFSTKWASLLVVPPALFLILDSQFVITILLGEDYLIAAPCLRILGTGYFLGALYGVNAVALTACGMTRQILGGSVLAVLTTVGGILLLMPAHGIPAVALSVAMAFVVSNTYRSGLLYWKYKIHFYTMEYLKPLLFSIGGCFLISQVFTLSPADNILWHAVLLLLFLIATALSPILTRSLTPNEIAVIQSVLTRLGRNSRLCNYLSNTINNRTV